MCCIWREPIAIAIAIAIPMGMAEAIAVPVSWPDMGTPE
jgi:hypothetical protein